MDFHSKDSYNIHLLLQNQTQLWQSMYSKNTFSFLFVYAHVGVWWCYNVWDRQQELFSTGISFEL